MPAEKSHDSLTADESSASNPSTLGVKTISVAWKYWSALSNRDDVSLPRQCSAKFDFDLIDPEESGRESEQMKMIENYKMCLLNSSNSTQNLGQLSTHLKSVYLYNSSNVAIETRCQMGNCSQEFNNIIFPIELKSTDYLEKNKPPSNDINLEMHISQLTWDLFAVHLSWTCPMEWNGFPDIYKIVCSRVPADDYLFRHSTDQSTVKMWNIEPGEVAGRGIVETNIRFLTLTQSLS